MPDIFGMPTPAEVQQAERDALQDGIEARGKNQTARGMYALTSLIANSIKTGTDTSQARAAERKRLMDEGMDEDEARKEARQRIRYETSDVRKARHMSELLQPARSLMDEMIEGGIPADRARAVAMLKTAGTLEDAGFGSEATQMRMTASELLQKQQERDLKVQQTKGEIENTEDTKIDRQIKRKADDDTYIKIENGVPSAWQSVGLTEIEKREKLRSEGWINVGSSSFGFSADVSSFGAAPQAVPEGVADDIIGGINMLAGLKVMRGIRDQVGWSNGFPQGAVRGVMANMGITAFGNEGFVDAVAYRKKMRADIQSIIKGIPSQYDATVFEAMIPDPTSFRGAKYYDAQLDVLESSTRDIVSMKIAFLKGTRTPVPPDILAAARAVGIDVGAVEAFTQDELKRENLDKYVSAMEARHRSDIEYVTKQAEQAGMTPGAPNAAPLEIKNGDGKVVGSIDRAGIKVIEE